MAVTSAVPASVAALSAGAVFSLSTLAGSTPTGRAAATGGLLRETMNTVTTSTTAAINRQAAPAAARITIQVLELIRTPQFSFGIRPLTETRAGIPRASIPKANGMACDAPRLGTL